MEKYLAIRREVLRRQNMRNNPSSQNSSRIEEMSMSRLANESQFTMHYENSMVTPNVISFFTFNSEAFCIGIL